MRRTVRSLFAVGAALTLSLGSVSTVLALPAQAADGASIVSDQPDYAPGALVTLTGAGWTSGENVHVIVDDIQGQTWQWQGDATAGDAGGFDLQFNLPEWFVADYSVLADNGMGTTATAYFTDSNVQVGAVNAAGTRLVANVVWTTFRKDASCTGSTLNTGDVDTVTNGTGFTGTTGVGSTTAMGLQAASPVILGGRVYTFDNWSGVVSSPTGSHNTFLCVPGNSDNGKINELAHYTDAGPVDPGKSAQTIDFPRLADKTYGDPDFALTATATSGLPVSYTVVAGSVCTVSGSTVHLTGVGDCTINADQAGNGSWYAAPQVTRSFGVLQGGTTVTVSCPPSVTYTSAALTPCTASATGAGGLNQSLDVSYTNNVNVGTATASASYAGDATHAAASNSATFAITKASSSVSITCPASVVYDGTAQTPCTASATGAGLTQSLTPTYTSNTNVGTAGVSASYAGDSNHTGSSNSTTFAITKATSTTTVTCSSSVTYTGSPVTPCSASATGDGITTPIPVSVTYADNTAVGTGSASATWAGDSNHFGSTGNNTFTISRASSTVTITCPGSVSYDGSAQTPCTAKASGAGMTDVPLTVTYSNNTNAGTATASASWAGDANHAASSATKDFTIGKAPSTTTLTCSDVTYDGSAQTPCTAAVTGAGGLSTSVVPSYTDNTNAGTGHASASYAGDDNHAASSDTATFTISKAGSSITFDCPTSVVYDATAKTPCTATVTGAGGLSQAVSVTYSPDHTNAGTVTVSASYAGDSNHDSTSNSTTFQILKAPSTTTVSCPASVVYNGSAQTPCSAAVTGVGGLSLTPTPSYSDNVSVGTATASYSYAGDANHAVSSDTKHFDITKATSTTTVTCTGAPYTYTGSAQTPCSASVTGAGGLSESLPVNYTNNTNAGTANAAAQYLGDLNHTGSSDSKDFTIGKAASTTTVTCTGAPFTYTGSGITPCTALATGVGGLSAAVTPVNYSNNTNAGTASASATYAGDDNHLTSTGTTTFVIGKAPSTTTLSCSSVVSYTGSALSPCTASATGVGLTSPVTVTPVVYTNNINVGTAGASATWAGDDNHNASTGSASFEISKASSVVTVTCTAASFTYTGSPIEPCTAKATGAGMSDVPLTVTYTADHTNVGTVTASAAWAGDSNHMGNNGSSTFSIVKAPSTTTVTCPASVTYTGSAVTPCSASVTGAGGLSLTRTPIYSSNVTVGTATASYAYAGDSNHEGSAGSASFQITPAAASLLYTGTEYVTQGTNAVLSATLSSSVSSCLSGQTINFVLTQVGTTTSITASAITGSTGQASTTIGTSSLTPGVYEITVILVPGNCQGPDATDSLTVVSPGDTANGGGWYTLDSTSTGSGRVNFGFTVQRVPNTTDGYKGQLLLQNNGKWRLKATLDCSNACYGKGTTSTGAPVGTVTGTGKLYRWDTSLNNGLGGWALANSTASFTANFTDAAQGGGKKSTDAFAIVISGYTTQPGDAPLPNSKLITLKGGDVKLT